MLNDFRIREFSEKEAGILNSLQLALIGDGVYEIFIRNHVLAKNTHLPVNKMHRETIKYVKAKSQAEIIAEIEPELNKEEIRIFKRGRNAKSHTVPKNADVRDYRNATGFEALAGYLYLTGQTERLEFIFQKSVEIIENRNKIK